MWPSSAVPGLQWAVEESRRQDRGWAAAVRFGVAVFAARSETARGYKLWGTACKLSLAVSSGVVGCPGPQRAAERAVARTAAAEALH